MKNIKAVILAGGLGTRLSEETYKTPKPMVEIGTRPIIWHIMKLYSYYGINKFIICCGYKGYLIKEYFHNYFLHNSDVTIDTKKHKITYHSKPEDDWKITLVDTGLYSQTAGRLKRVYNYLKNDDIFCLTYGDGLSNVNIKELIKFHKSHKKLATITAVVPPGRFGSIELDNNSNIKNFVEKPKINKSFINGGFFVMSPKCINLIKDDDSILEVETLKNLVKNKQIKTYIHKGFWQPMDTLREKNLLNSLWNQGQAPWKVWK